MQVTIAESSGLGGRSEYGPVALENEAGLTIERLRPTIDSNLPCDDGFVIAQLAWLSRAIWPAPTVLKIDKEASWCKGIELRQQVLLSRNAAQSTRAG